MPGLFNGGLQDIINYLQPGRGKNRSATAAYGFTGSSNLSRAGKDITPENAMTNSTVFSSVNLIADTISQTNIKIVRRGDPDGTSIDHPMLELLQNPNDLMTQFEYFHAILVDLLVWGNSYTWKNKVGKAMQLVPLDPRNITINTNVAGKVVYKEHSGNQLQALREYPANQIIHFRDIAVHQGVGLSRVEQCADLIGADWVLDDIIADNLKNGNSVSGTLSSDQSIKPEEATNIAKAWKDKFNGDGNDRGGVLILGGGMSYTPVEFLNLVNADAIALKTQYMSRIAAVFRVPAQYLEIPGNSNYNNVSQKKTSFYSDTLAPIFKNLELKLSYDLLKGTGLMVEFEKEALMKGDLVSQGGLANNLVAGGIMTPNEARAFLGYPEIEGADELRDPKAANNERNTGGDSRGNEEETENNQ